MAENAPEPLRLKLRNIERQGGAGLRWVKLALPAVDDAGAHFHIALVAQFLEYAVEALFGDLQNIEKLGDGEARTPADEMQDAVMGAAKAVIFEQPVGIADIRLLSGE